MRVCGAGYSLRSWDCWLPGGRLWPKRHQAAYTDPFSARSPRGDEFLKNFQFIIARKNAAGGALGKKYELVPFDDKLQPAEAVDRAQSMTDRTFRS